MHKRGKTNETKRKSKKNEKKLKKINAKVHIQIELMMNTSVCGDFHFFFLESGVVDYLFPIFFYKFIQKYMRQKKICICIPSSSSLMLF